MGTDDLPEQDNAVRQNRPKRSITAGMILKDAYIITESALLFDLKFLSDFNFATIGDVVQ